MLCKLPRPFRAFQCHRLLATDMYSMGAHSLLFRTSCRFGGSGGSGFVPFQVRVMTSASVALTRRVSQAAATETSASFSTLIAAPNKSSSLSGRSDNLKQLMSAWPELAGKIAENADKAEQLRKEVRARN